MGASLEDDEPLLFGFFRRAGGAPARGASCILHFVFERTPYAGALTSQWSEPSGGSGGVRLTRLRARSLARSLLLSGICVKCIRSAAAVVAAERRPSSGSQFGAARSCQWASC
jgi:hypothetical protein